MTQTILVVEDDLPLQDALVTTLESAGYRVLAAADGGAALDLMNDSPVDLVVSDVQMQPVDGRELLKRLQQRHPALPVLLMTAYGTIEQAVAAMREGAVDYLVKPFEADELERRVVRYLQPAAPRTRRDVDSDARPDVRPIAVDPRSQELLALSSRVAASDMTVLLTGESGTGKEIFARYIHAASRRNAGPFVAVNCAAIPEQMLEAILFGHEKGAFTGAQAKSVGKFVQANGGTLLLDEVTEMDLNLQAKLLRVLQEREVEPIGAAKPVALDVRVLATSNRDLAETVRDGKFREDLYYRLSVFPLAIPALRERRGDIVPLAERFIAAHARVLAPRLTEAATGWLRDADWPGNVRELQNTVQRALLLAEGEPAIDVRHLRRDDRLHAQPLRAPAVQTSDAVDAAAITSANASTGLAGELWAEEARRIVSALEAHHGGRKRAAAQLGVSERTLRYKLSKLRAAGIQVPGDRG